MRGWMLPKHIAIIPDGNRRWAARKKVPLAQAYSKGIDHIADVLKWCKKHKINTLTMWGFSTENFMRSKKEVGELFRLFSQKLSEGLKHDYKKYKVRVRFLGRISELPKDVQEKMKKVENETEKNDKYTLNLLLAYGGRQEILDAVNAAVSSGVKKFDEESFSKLLYLKDSPDLVIRTSGEIRTSGFLPWQSSYSEYYFSKKLWPDFAYSDFKKALKDYSRRRRKYGK
ncbi:MAG: polyprenyl diphosphate synthase [Candidatus Micrarchaeota archaeon]|nr:polyprenyl diphosphate synthase [Candidatus Micrarchaeota archaeon]